MPSGCLEHPSQDGFGIGCRHEDPGLVGDDLREAAERLQPGELRSWRIDDLDARIAVHDRAADRHRERTQHVDGAAGQDGTGNGIDRQVVGLRDPQLGVELDDMLVEDQASEPRIAVGVGDPVDG